MTPKPQTTQLPAAGEQPTAKLSGAQASQGGPGATIGEKPIAAPAVAPPPAFAPQPAVAPAPANTPAPTSTPASALAMPTSDRCSACGTALAGDQRYCVECGERHGTARFALPTRGPAAEPATKSARVRRSPRMSASGTLIAGVGTLLLAMGIGVLIGQSGNGSGGQRAANPAPVQVVTVGGGTGGSTNASAARTTGAKKTSPTSKSHKSSKKTTGATTATTATVQSAPPPTVTIGAKGSGAGYQHGHFTGNFFGP